MTRREKGRFPLLADQAGAAGAPYDTYRLRRLHDAMSCLVKHGGSDHVHVFRAGGPGATQNNDDCRPLVSATCHSTFLAVPVLLSDGLERLHISFDLCVGLGEPRVNADAIDPSLRTPVNLRASFASDPSRDRIAEEDVLPLESGGYWSFRRVSLRLDASWTIPGPDVLMLSFQSIVDPEAMDTSAWFQPALSDYPPVVRDHAEISDIRRREVLFMEDDTYETGQPLYTESADDGEIGSKDNSITATILVRMRAPSANEEPASLRLVDHVEVGSSGDSMMIWPHVEQLENTSGDYYARAAKVWAPWLQVRSVTIREEYGYPDYPSVRDLQSGALASASPYRALRRQMDRSLRRPRLLWAGTPGVDPDPGGTWLTGNSYKLLHPVTNSDHQDCGSSLVAGGIPPYASGRAVARLLLAGVYRGMRFSSFEIPTWSDWDEAIDHGVEADVIIAGQTVPVQFAAQGVAGGSHALTTKSAQIFDKSAAGGRVYREGLLDISSEGNDRGILQTVEVDLEDLDDIAITWPADEQEANIRWIGETQVDQAGEMSDGSWEPLLAHCYLFVVGYSVYWIADGGES